MGTHWNTGRSPQEHLETLGRELAGSCRREEGRKVTIVTPDDLGFAHRVVEGRLHFHGVRTWCGRPEGWAVLVPKGARHAREIIGRFVALDGWVKDDLAVPGMFGAPEDRGSLVVSRSRGRAFDEMWPQEADAAVERLGAEIVADYRGDLGEFQVEEDAETQGKKLISGAYDGGGIKTVLPRGGNVFAQTLRGDEVIVSTAWFPLGDRFEVISFGEHEEEHYFGGKLSDGIPWKALARHAQIVRKISQGEGGGP